MSAALKSYVPRPVRSRRGAATAPTPVHQIAAPAKIRSKVSPPVVLPTAPGLDASSPAVRRLSRLHLVSSVLAGSLVALTLISYGTSVYINRQLNQANQRLSRLQRSEQQLTTANEVLKNHLAQQVEVEGMGFYPPQPGNVIFLKPSPHTAAAGAVPTAAVNRLALPKVDVPLGY